MPRHAFVLAALGGLALLASATLPAQEVDLGTGPVVLTADSLRYDSRSRVVTAEGAVEFSRDGRRLQAARVDYDETTDRVEAIGDVVLIEATGEAIFADRLTLTGDLREGLIEELRILLADDTRIAAARGTRSDGNRTVMERVVYSPCELCPDTDRPPLWQLKAREVVHDQESQEVSYRHAFLEILGVPVAYAPYFAHPDPTVERKSGFLVPRVGSDTELGLILEAPYHYVVASNRDVTLAPIVTSKEGLVLAGEYRELRAWGPAIVSGSITRGSTLDDDEPGTQRSVRGHIDGEARYDLADALGTGWRGGADLALSSDRTYRRRYGFGNDNILTNRLFAERRFERSHGVVNAYAFQGLREDDDRERIPIVLPAAATRIESTRGRFGERWTMDASVLALTRTGGLDTRRASFEGGIEIPRRGNFGDLFELRASLRGDAYHIDGDPITRDDTGETDFVGRLLPRVSLDWRLPLVRDDGAWQHLIEPTIGASWSPYGGNDPRIPNEDSLDFEFDDTNLFEPVRFTGLDRVEGGPKLAYGLRFQSDGPGGGRVAGLIGQSFRLKDDDTFGSGSGLEGRFSDYVGRIEMSPHRMVDLGYRFRARKDEFRLVRNDVRIGLGPRRLRFDLGYLMLADEADEDEFTRREELTATFSVGLTDDLVVALRTRRDLTADTTIANSLGLVYNDPCLLLVAGIEQSFTRTGDARPTTTVSLRASFRTLGDLRGGSTFTNRS